MDAVSFSETSGYYINISQLCQGFDRDSRNLDALFAPPHSPLDKSARRGYT